MSGDASRLPWTDEQWASVQQLVQTAARKARVASSFLPLVGPLPPGQSTVPALEMAAEDDPDGGRAQQRLVVDEGTTLRLTTIACEIYLSTQEAEDPALAAATAMLGRAADVLGRLEDAIVFRGQPGAGQAPVEEDDGSLVVVPPVYTVSGGQERPGLLNAGRLHREVRAGEQGGLGEALVGAVVSAIQALEKGGHYGPFACVLGHDLYLAATTPNHSLVLPSDRITPFLDGPLLRSSVIPDRQGVVVSLAAAPVDLVIGTDIAVGFLQRSLEPKFVVRVSERFVAALQATRRQLPSPPGKRSDPGRQVTWPAPLAPLSKLRPEGAPFPHGQVLAGSPAALDVVAEPPHPANRVEAQLRQGNGAVRVVPLASRAGTGAFQRFIGSLPQLAPGQALDYRLALSRAGQLLSTWPADGSWLPVVGQVVGPPTGGVGPPASASATTAVPDRPRWAYELDFFAALTVDLRAEVLGPTPEGYRVNFFVKQGTVKGHRIDAEVLPEGGDWMCIRSDGIGMVDISITYKTTDGALILERAGGVFDLGPDGYAKVAAGSFTGSPPFYATPTWQTAHPEWSWLNRCQGFGVGRVVLEQLQVRCDIYLPKVGGALPGPPNA